MKAAHFLAILFLTVLSHASELRVEYTAGWAPDYILNVDFARGKASYSEGKSTSSDKIALKQGQIKNSKNVGEYVKALIQRIPEDNPGGVFGDDSPLYKITFIDGEFRKSFTIGSIHPPGAIHLNEGRTAEEELDEAEAFKGTIDSYLLCNLIGYLVEDLANAKK